MAITVEIRWLLVARCRIETCKEQILIMIFNFFTSLESVKKLIHNKRGLNSAASQFDDHATLATAANNEP